MSKKTKGGSGNALLLAGLSVGAFMLFANKSNAQANNASADLAPGSSGSDIPDTPKILAVNSSDTESPTPTGIVSDDEGMQTVNNQSSGDDDEDSGSRVVQTITNAGVKLLRQAADDADIPPLVSTKLTPKETAIINSGKLTAALALKRPDLYKAAYIKKYGGKTATGKRKALIAASLAIDAAVNAANAAKSGGLVKAVKYPAKPQHTFVQTAGGMAAQMAISQMAALQKAGVQVSPAAQKVSAQVKSAKGSKGRHPANPGHARTAHPAKRRIPSRPASHGNTARIAGKKKAVRKHH